MQRCSSCSRWQVATLTRRSLAIHCSVALHCWSTWWPLESGAASADCYHLCDGVGQSWWFWWQRSPFPHLCPANCSVGRKYIPVWRFDRRHVLRLRAASSFLCSPPKKPRGRKMRVQGNSLRQGPVFWWQFLNLKNFRRILRWGAVENRRCLPLRRVLPESWLPCSGRIGSRWIRPWPCRRRECRHCRFREELVLRSQWRRWSRGDGWGTSVSWSWKIWCSWDGASCPGRGRRPDSERWRGVWLPEGSGSSFWRFCERPKVIKNFWG